MALEWHDAGTEEPGDQNATALSVHGYWSIGPGCGGVWTVSRITLGEWGDEVEYERFPDAESEADAKATAERVEASA